MGLFTPDVSSLNTPAECKEKADELLNTAEELQHNKNQRGWSRKRRQNNEEIAHLASRVARKSKALPKGDKDKIAFNKVGKMLEDQVVAIGKIKEAVKEYIPWL